MADRHQVFRTHLRIAGHVVRIGFDIGDQLRLARARAAARGADAHRPTVRELGRIQVEVAGPDFLHEVRAVVVEQDDAGDGDRQVAHQAIHDAPQHGLEVLALQRFARDLGEQARQARMPNGRHGVVPCARRLLIQFDDLWPVHVAPEAPRGRV